MGSIEAIASAATRLDAKGWAEGSGGNLSMLVDDWTDTVREGTCFPLAYDVETLYGRLVLITRSGCRLGDVESDPERNLALVRIEKGRARMLWGLRDGGKPSSELAAHLLSHASRLSRDPSHRVVAHTHATHAVAMGMLCTQDERMFTRLLWSMCTEALMFLPDGVGILPWMPCGTDEIGKKTAEKLLEFPLVLWQNHGVFASGATPEEALGRVEIADKAAELYLLTRNGEARVIDISQLRELARVLDIKPRQGWLD